MTTNNDTIILKRLNTALEKAIQQQVYDNNPPETSETLEKLMEKGASEEKAYNLIGLVISQHFRTVIEGDMPFDMDAYIKDLELLVEKYDEYHT